MLTNEELKKLSLKDLQKELEETQAEYVKADMGIQTKETRATSKLNALRKQCARINTFKRMLELETKERASESK